MTTRGLGKLCMILGPRTLFQKRSPYGEFIGQAELERLAGKKITGKELLQAHRASKNKWAQLMEYGVHGEPTREDLAKQRYRCTLEHFFQDPKELEEAASLVYEGNRNPENFTLQPSVTELFELMRSKSWGWDKTVALILSSPLEQVLWSKLKPLGAQSFSFDEISNDQINNAEALTCKLVAFEDPPSVGFSTPREVLKKMFPADHEDFVQLYVGAGASVRAHAGIVDAWRARYRHIVAFTPGDNEEIILKSSDDNNKKKLYKDNRGVYGTRNFMVTNIHRLAYVERLTALKDWRPKSSRRVQVDMVWQNRVIHAQEGVNFGKSMIEVDEPSQEAKESETGPYSIRRIESQSVAHIAPKHRIRVRRITPGVISGNNYSIRRIESQSVAHIAPKHRIRVHRITLGVTSGNN